MRTGITFGLCKAITMFFSHFSRGKIEVAIK